MSDLLKRCHECDELHRRPSAYCSDTCRRVFVARLQGYRAALEEQGRVNLEQCRAHDKKQRKIELAREEIGGSAHQALHRAEQTSEEPGPYE